MFSACIDPLFSLDQLKHEATIRHFLKASATNSYHSNHLAAPPILVYIFELLSEFNERYTGLLHLLISFLLGFVDLTISYLLYEVAIIGIKSSSKEIELEGFMPRQIRPPRAWVFGIKLPKVLPKVDVQAEENIQQLRLSAAKIDSNCVVDETSKRNEVHTKQEHEYDATIDLESYIDYQDIPSIAASLYLLNPITILSSSCMLSMQSLGPLFILLALASSYKGRYHNSAWWIACSSAFEQSPYPLLILLIPLLSLSLHRFDPVKENHGAIVHDIKNKSRQKQLLIIGNILVSLIVSHFVLTYLSVKALPYKNTSISMLLKHQTNRWSFANLTPNPGLQWYLFTQVFHQFRFYCTQIMVGMPFVWVAPLTLRLYHYPLELATSFLLLWQTFKPVFTFYDVSFVFPLMLFFPRTLARTTLVTTFSMLAISIPLVLYLTFHEMWLDTGMGNPNYLYFQSLAFNVFYAAIALDFVSACCKRDKALRYTEKHILQKLNSRINGIATDSSGSANKFL